MRLRILTSALCTLGLCACTVADAEIDSYEECAAAGYPIMESYPEQCRTPDGRTFVREIPAGNDVDTSDLITVESPAPDDVLAGMVEVIGEARGNWYFEATFPVELLDADGNTLVTTYAEAQSDWMTTDWVPFTTTFTVPATDSPTGTLVLHKSNASGLPEHDASVRIPVRFE